MTFSDERAKGRCECRGQCGGHAGKRCLTFFGQSTMFGQSEDVLYEVKVVHGKPKTERQVKYVCEACRLTFDPWRAEVARRGESAAVSDHDIYIKDSLERLRNGNTPPIP